MPGTVILLKNKTLLGLFLATFFVFSSFTAFFPVLPLHLQQLGASNLLIGMIMSAFPVGVLVFRPPVGWFLSHKGRSWTLWMGTVLLLVSSLFYPLARDAMLLLVVRFFHGLGIAAYTTASIVLISDVTTFENRGSVMGYLGVANYLGFGLGPYLASRLYHTAGINSVFYSAAGLVVFALLSLFLVREPEVPHSAQENETDVGIREMVRQRFFLVPSLFVLIAALVQGSVVNFLPLYLAARNPQLEAGTFFLFFSISVIFIRIVAGKAADRHGRGIVIFFATLLLISSLIVLSMTASLALLILAGMLYGAGYGSQQPTLTALVADHTTFRTRSTLFSIYYAVFDFGMLLSGYLLGVLADRAGILQIYPFSVAVYAVGVVVFLTQIQSSLRQSIRWVFSSRGSGKICRICYNQIGIDPCHICGHRGGRRSALDSAAHRISR